MDNQVFVMNPIREKLKKLFVKGKRRLRNQSTLHTSVYSKSFRMFDKENNSQISNNTNDTSKSIYIKNDQGINVREQNLKQILQDNQKLKEKIKTHELMEQFYLKQLELRRKEKTNLEWRLSVLNEEIQNSSQIKRRCTTGCQILNDRVYIARKGMELTYEDQHN